MFKIHIDIDYMECDMIISYIYIEINKISFFNKNEKKIIFLAKWSCIRQIEKMCLLKPYQPFGNMPYLGNRKLTKMNWSNLNTSHIDESLSIFLQAPNFYAWWSFNLTPPLPFSCLILSISVRWHILWLINLTIFYMYN